MKMVLHGVQFDSQVIAEFCQRHDVARLSLFGSILSDDFSEASDVDLLVEFKPGKRIGLFGNVRLGARTVQADWPKGRSSHPQRYLAPLSPARDGRGAGAICLLRNVDCSANDRMSCHPESIRVLFSPAFSQPWQGRYTIAHGVSRGGKDRRIARAPAGATPGHVPNHRPALRSILVILASRDRQSPDWLFTGPLARVEPNPLPRLRAQRRFPKPSRLRGFA